MKRSIKLLTLGILLSSVFMAQETQSCQTRTDRKFKNSVMMSGVAGACWGGISGVYAACNPQYKDLTGLGAVALAVAASHAARGAAQGSIPNDAILPIAAGATTGAGFMTAFILTRAAFWGGSCLRDLLKAGFKSRGHSPSDDAQPSDAQSSDVPQEAVPQA